VSSVSGLPKAPALSAWRELSPGLCYTEGHELLRMAL
jgi:hypothetical protein